MSRVSDRQFLEFTLVHGRPAAVAGVVGLNARERY